MATTIEEALIGFLTAANTSAASNVFPVELPEKGTYPAATIQLVSDPEEYDQDGPLLFHESRYQITAFARTYSQAKLLNRQIKNEIDGFGPDWMEGVFVDAIQRLDSGDILDAEPGLEQETLYGVRTDYRISYQDTNTES